MTVGYSREFDVIRAQAVQAREILAETIKQIGLYQMLERGDALPTMFVGTAEKHIELPDILNDPATRAAALQALFDLVRSNMALLADLHWRLDT